MIYEQIQLVLTPRTLHVLLPHIQRALDEEWESDVTRNELHNLVNELRARLQRTERGE